MELVVCKYAERTEKKMSKIWNRLWDKKIFRYAMISAALWSLVHVYAFS